jgi:hypothetical protein
MEWAFLFFFSVHKGLGGGRVVITLEDYQAGPYISIYFRSQKAYPLMIKALMKESQEHFLLCP